MELYSENEQYKLYHWNMLDMLNYIEGGVIDSIVTDPPYELNFMWKWWDNSWIAFSPDTWKKCLEVLKPWWYLLAFGWSRTYHRIACAIEDAGFEIRDCIMWLYGSWFPKSLALDKSIEWKLTTWSANTQWFRNLNWEKADRWTYWYAKMKFEQWDRPADYNKIEDSRLWKLEATTELARQYKGWWTALKPSYEPIIVARKPLEWSCADNVIKYWVGWINIDECKVGAEKHSYQETDLSQAHWNNLGTWQWSWTTWKIVEKIGRFPANTILTYWDDDKEEVCSWFPHTKSTYNKDSKHEQEIHRGNADTLKYWYKTRIDSSSYNDEWSAARYFYCAKASRRDRDEGLGTETIIDIILSDNNWKIWKGENIIRDEKSVNADIEAYLKSDTGEYEILSKEDLDLSIILYMKNIIEKYLNECKSTTKMGINSTTIYQILNWLIHLNTKENTLDVKKYDEKYISHVESAENWNLFEITIKEKSELVHDVNNAVLKMQLRIREKEKHSTHPTVKPTDLMQYLVRLVTPNGWTVLDPFNWSGSTWKAVMYENKDRNKNYKYIWIELTDEYLPIAKARIEYVINKWKQKEELLKQQSLF